MYIWLVRREGEGAMLICFIWCCDFRSWLEWLVLDGRGGVIMTLCLYRSAGYRQLTCLSEWALSSGVMLVNSEEGKTSFPRFEKRRRFYKLQQAPIYNINPTWPTSFRRSIVTMQMGTSLSTWVTVTVI